MTVNQSSNQVDLFESYIPSKHLDLLKELKHRKIEHLVRYSWDPPSESAEEIKERFNAPASCIFRRAYGPLLITLDSGLIIGFGEKPSEGSVMVWVEKNENGERRIEDSLLDDEDAYCIDALDQMYSEAFIYSLIGQDIISVSIMKRDDPGWAREVAGEVGIIFKFKNGSELIISRDLCENIDDFALILRDEIDPEILTQLQEISI